MDNLRTSSDQNLSTKSCRGETPTSFYLRTDFQNNAAQPGAEVGFGIRDFDPKSALSHYSIEEFQCWAKKGDPIADYMVVAKSVGESRLVAIDDHLDEFDENIIAHLKAASSTRKCQTQMEEQVLFCSRGMPEAKYLLGRYFLERSETNYMGKSLLREAAHENLFIASQWVY